MPSPTATTSVPGSPQVPAAPVNPIMNFMPIIVIGGILYMLVIRPQQKQAKVQKKMVDDLKKGDRVLTQAGIYGTVVNLKGPILELKIAENVKVDIARSAVTQVIQEPSHTTPVSGERPS